MEKLKAKELKENQALFDAVTDRIYLCPELRSGLADLYDFQIKPHTIKGKAISRGTPRRGRPTATYTEVLNAVASNTAKNELHRAVALTIGSLVPANDRLFCFLTDRKHFDTLTDAFDKIDSKAFFERR